MTARKKKPAGPGLPLAGPARPACMVEGCPGVSHLHGLCEEHWADPSPMLLWAVAPTDLDGGYWAGADADAPRWELVTWRSGGSAGRPDRVELFESEQEARVAADAYVAQTAPGPT